MTYRSLLLILVLAAVIAAPASANLKKIDAEAQVFVGETGLDISSALNGCRQIAWWPAGNKTDTPPGKVLAIGDNLRNYPIDPAVFSNYTGAWYSYDKKPSVVVFEVVKPEFDLRVWDLDHDRDITGQTVPAGTRITYRIDTNLFPVLNKYLRPDINNLDTFMKVTLTSPAGNAINSIYTGSAGLGETVVLAFDDTPRVLASPYYWKDGGRWNRSARSGEGALIYQPGTYTFTASQNLNGMSAYYNATDPVLATGPRTITFVADEPAAVTPSAIRTAASPPPASRTGTAAPPAQTPGTTPTVKTTWTSTPLPPALSLLALCTAGAASLFLRKRSR